MFVKLPRQTLMCSVLACMLLAFSINPNYAGTLYGPSGSSYSISPYQTQGGGGDGGDRGGGNTTHSTSSGGGAGCASTPDRAPTPTYPPKGTSSEEFPHTHYVDNRGHLLPDYGYQWESRDNPEDKRVKFIDRGTPNTDYPNTVWDGNGETIPAFGYKFFYPFPESSLGRISYETVPIPEGTPSTDYPDTVWDGEGNLYPALGYIWLDQEKFKVTRYGISDKAYTLVTALERISRRPIYYPRDNDFAQIFGLDKVPPPGPNYDHLITNNCQTFFRALGDELAKQKLPSWNKEFPLDRSDTLDADGIVRALDRAARNNDHWKKIESKDWKKAQDAANKGAVVIGGLLAGDRRTHGHLAIVMPLPPQISLSAFKQAGDGPFIRDGNEHVYNPMLTHILQKKRLHPATWGAIKASRAMPLNETSWYIWEPSD